MEVFLQKPKHPALKLDISLCQLPYDRGNWEYTIRNDVMHGTFVNCNKRTRSTSSEIISSSFI